MHLLLKEIRHNPLLWLLVFVPAVVAAEHLGLGTPTLLFVLAILAIVPLAALSSRATEAVAAKTGDAVGGMLSATLGNMTEMIVALTALAAGEYMLTKATMTGAIVTKSLFVLGISFFAGGLKHHVQEFNQAGAKLQAGQLFLAIIALLIPSAVGAADAVKTTAFTQHLSASLAVLLLVIYGLGLLFSLKTHKEFFSGDEPKEEEHEDGWSMGLSLGVLAGVTGMTVLVSDVFVSSMQEASKTLGMTDVFVGFVVVALVGGIPEMASAVAAARRDRLDVSVGIALGSATQIAVCVVPVLVLVSYVMGPSPMTLQFWPGAVVMMLLATLTAAMVTNGSRTAWFIGVLLIGAYLTFAITLYLLPPMRL